MARISTLVTVIVVAAMVAAFMWLKPFSGLTSQVPPTEVLTFESIALDNEGVHAVVRAEGSEPVVIAQVLVDGAYRTFTQTPKGPLSRLERARIDIPYFWIAGEPLAISMLTATGITFDHTVEVATGREALGGAGLLQLALIGLFVGFVPILAGYGFLPGLRALGDTGRDFALGLTVGLLLFLLIDTMSEGLTFAAAAAPGLHAGMGFWTVTLLVAVILFAAARWRGGAPKGAKLAFFIALGIGFHNLGEGVAIGASIATGEVALAAFLIIGFFLHNLSEAIAITAPYRGARIGFATLLGLALLAGAPAAIGTIAGGFAFTPFRATLAFAVGAGAILQVLAELGRMLFGGLDKASGAATAVGFCAGLAIMYVTALLIAG